MADIFISYARKDRLKVAPLGKALQDQGWSVFWDRAIPGGKTWDEVIEEELEGARCVVVVWSKNGVGSRWVRAEAEEGLNRNILVPVSIEPLKPPLLFRPIQAVELSDWGNDPKHRQFKKFILDLEAILGASPLKSKEAESKKIKEEQPKKDSEAKDKRRQEERPSDEEVKTTSHKTEEENRRVKNKQKVVGEAKTKEAKVIPKQINNYKTKPKLKRFSKFIFIVISGVIALSLVVKFFNWYAEPGRDKEFQISTPGNKSIFDIGAKVHFREKIRSSNEVSLKGAKTIWSSSNSEIASISSDGLMKTLKRGVVEISANKGKLSDNSVIMVLPDKDEAEKDFEGFGSHIIKPGDHVFFSYNHDGKNEKCRIGEYRKGTQYDFSCGKNTASGHLASLDRRPYNSGYWWFANTLYSLELIDKKRKIVHVKFSHYKHKTLNNSNKIRPGDRYILGKDSWVDYDNCVMEDGKLHIYIRRWGIDSSNRLNIVGQCVAQKGSKSEIDKGYLVKVNSLSRDELSCIADITISPKI